MPQTLASLVFDNRGTDEDDPVLTFVAVAGDGTLVHEHRSFAQLWERGQAMAGWLRGRGVAVGDRIAIMMNNHPEFVDAMVAAAIVGAVWVPIDSRARGEKLQYMLDFSGCVGVIAADYCAAALAEAAPACPAFAWTLLVGDRPADSPAPAGLPGCTALAEIDPAPAAQPQAEFDPGHPMSMMFTSGTTGNPKAVVASHGEWMAYARASHIAFQPGDRLYTGLSLTHINAQSFLRLALAFRVPLVISLKFTKSRLWEVLRAYGCTIFSLLGGMIPEVFAIPERPDDADNPVRMIMSSGMPANLWDAYRRRYGVEIQEGYGATEAAGGLMNPPGQGPVGSIGRASPGLRAAVFDENDRPCPPGVPGELRMRPENGEARPVPYYRNEEAGRAKVRDGWFMTGDIVHMDAEGWFWFHHRAGGGVRRNGDFVNTALVESAISASGLVDDIFVYGVATARNVAGEKALVAAVVPAAGGVFDAAALLDHCRRALEPGDVPEIVQVLDAIPKTASEKPIEREAIELLRAAGLVEAYEARSGASA